LAKKVPPPTPKSQEEEPLKRLTLNIPQSLHTRIRIDALKRNTTATEIVTEVLMRVWPGGT
jgi:hypothetical protein